jgi:hypothetical protein
VLRFISGKYEGGEFPLAAEAEVVIGRGGELDIVLVEDMVSRKHAKIRTADGKIVIEDLGSTNGTFVNGEKIKRARLKANDRVLVGTSIMKLVETNAPGDAKDFKPTERSGDPSKATTMSGGLEDMPLRELVSTLAHSRQSGTLVVKTEDDEGKIFMRGGKLYYALLNDNEDLGPEKALFRMLMWERGTFQLGPSSDQQFLLEIDDETQGVIMEATRQLDEYRVLAPSLPEVEDIIGVPKPLNVPLTKLQPEELEIFQLVFNQGFFQAVLDLSPYTDLKTSQLVKFLIDNDYLVVESL